MQLTDVSQKAIQNFIRDPENQRNPSPFVFDFLLEIVDSNERLDNANYTNKQDVIKAVKEYLTTL